MVSALFPDSKSVERAVGALRAEGILATRISITEPGGQAEPLAVEGADRHGIGTRLVARLLRRGHAHEQPLRSADHVAAVGWLVSVLVQSEVEEREARTLLISAGADEISSAADGKMIRVAPQELVAPAGR
jgi:hypothetical protein